MEGIIRRKLKRLLPNNPYMLDINDFMSLPERRKYVVLLTSLANAHQTIENIARELERVKKEIGL